jgi:hypothetical protein
LSRRYGAPIDVGLNSEDLNSSRFAQGKGELTFAQIGALALRFPDPPLAAPKLQ